MLISNNITGQGLPRNYRTTTNASPVSQNNVQQDEANLQINAEVIYERSQGPETTNRQRNTATHSSRDSSVNGTQQQREAAAIALQQRAQIQESFVRMITTSFGNQANSTTNTPTIRQTATATTTATSSVDIGGYHGVEQTSERILNFAIALSGGDPETMEMLREYVIRGFEAAEEQWGSALPPISQETFARVMQGFDDFATQ
jgi:predicted RNA-binding Zn ribbon-like protein